MQHDRRFKEFLQRFLPQFLTLFFPEQAAQLDFKTLIFLDKELFVNLPGQVLRITDLVAEVDTLDGDKETIIVHIEVESRNKQTLPERMFEYYSLLRILRRKRVFPIAILLLPSKDGLTWETYKETLFDEELLNFRYARVGIRSLLSEIYLQKPDAVAAALAVLMKYRKPRSAEIKLAALRKIIESDLTAGDKLFLIDFVEVYVPTGKLPVATEDVMQKLAELETTWVTRALQEGLEKGLEKGREEGQQEGQHKVLLYFLTVKFGPLPPEFVEKVKKITDEQAIQAIIQQALLTNTLAELKLPAPVDEQ